MRSRLSNSGVRRQCKTGCVPSLTFLVLSWRASRPLRSLFFSGGASGGRARYVSRTVLVMGIMWVVLCLVTHFFLSFIVSLSLSSPMLFLPCGLEDLSCLPQHLPAMCISKGEYDEPGRTLVHRKRFCFRRTFQSNSVVWRQTAHGSSSSWASSQVGLCPPWLCHAASTPPGTDSACAGHSFPSVLPNRLWQPVVGSSSLLHPESLNRLWSL